MLICRFLIDPWVTSSTGLHAVVLKKHLRFLILSSAAVLYSPSVRNAPF